MTDSRTFYGSSNFRPGGDFLPRQDVERAGPNPLFLHNGPMTGQSPGWSQLFEGFPDPAKNILNVLTPVKRFSGVNISQMSSLFNTKNRGRVTIQSRAARNQFCWGRGVRAVRAGSLGRDYPRLEENTASPNWGAGGHGPRPLREGPSAL